MRTEKIVGHALGPELHFPVRMHVDAGVVMPFQHLGIRFLRLFDERVIPRQENVVQDVGYFIVCRVPGYGRLMCFCGLTAVCLQ